jgi:catechol 2,3-dioxygenase-like lactoylglutathione lyase family enzyme
MFSHVMVGTNDLDRAKSFYDALLGTLDVPPATVNGQSIFYMTPTGTIGFAAKSPQRADAWHAASVANGGTTCEDPPGVREAAVGRLYLAYLRDPDGNKICALHRMG